MELFLASMGLLLSFFFAGSEAAFMAFNNLRLEVWERQKKPFARSARKFTEHPENFYSTILLGNNTANIAYSTFATVFLIKYMNETLAWLIITFIVLFWGEIFPKVLFRTYANRLALNVLLIVRLFYIISMPFVKFVNWLIKLYYRILKIQGDSVAYLFSREELQILLEEESESADSDRQKYISNILDFSSARVTEAMIPRTEIIAVSEDCSWEELVDVMVESSQYYLPVYRESLDNITGVVFLFDILDPVQNIRDITKQVQFVPETKNCSELLREFQMHNVSLAVVIDEYGGTEGVVTTDDLIEVVFGEFLEPYEVAADIKALNNHTWLIDARMGLEELSEKVDIIFPNGEYETLAGFILNHTGQIPKVNEKILFKNYRLEIMEASPKQINKVKLVKSIKE